MKMIKDMYEFLVQTYLFILLSIEKSAVLRSLSHCTFIIYEALLLKMACRLKNLDNALPF